MGQKRKGGLDDDRIFVAEKIIQKRFTKSGTSEYLIKWAKFSSLHNTWESELNIIDKSLISDYDREARQTRWKRAIKFHRSSRKPCNKKTCTKFVKKIVIEEVVETTVEPKIVKASVSKRVQHTPVLEKQRKICKYDIDEAWSEEAEKVKPKQLTPKASKLIKEKPVKKEDGPEELIDFYTRHSSSTNLISDISLSQESPVSKRSSSGSVFSTVVKNEGSSQLTKLTRWKEENVRPKEIVFEQKLKSMIRFSNGQVIIVSDDLMQTVFPSEYDKMKRLSQRKSFSFTSQPDTVEKPVPESPPLNNVEPEVPSPLFSSDNSNCSLMSNDTASECGGEVFSDNVVKTGVEPDSS